MCVCKSECLWMTCLPSQKQICYFHHFSEEKQTWRKPQKCNQASTPSFKKKSELRECEYAIKHERLFWIINTLTLSLSPQPQMTVFAAKTLTHSKLLGGQPMSHSWVSNKGWNKQQSREDVFHLSKTEKIYNCWCIDRTLQNCCCGDSEVKVTWPYLFLQTI